MTVRCEGTQGSGAAQRYGGVVEVDAELEFDEATVRGVAAALMDSAEELARLAVRVDATRGAGCRVLGRVVRDWADRTAADAARLTATADGYAAQEAESGAAFRRLEP
ncbi:hypothetical protein [Rhodococcus olei]